jgi:hypothetical protein
MESILLAIKYVVFYGLEAFVVAAVGATVIAVLYQFIRNQVRIVRKGPFAQPTPTRRKSG